jgi:hypothetical protein
MKLARYLDDYLKTELTLCPVLHWSESWSLPAVVSSRLSALENRALRRIYETQEGDVAGGWRNCVQTWFIIHTSRQILLWWRHQDAREERCKAAGIGIFTFCWPCIMLWFLVNEQLDAQFFTMCLFLFLFLYMFRAHRAHHQERQIVSTQRLVTFTVCRWPVCKFTGRKFTSNLHTTRPPTQSDSYQRLYWHNLSLLMMSTMCSKHVEK